MKILLYILSLPSALITAIIIFAYVFGPFYGGDFIVIIFTPMGFTFFAGAVVFILYYFVRSKSILTMSIKIGIPLLAMLLWWVYDYYTSWIKVTSQEI